MNVVRLRVAARQTPQDARLAMMADALAHLDCVVAMYRQAGSRPNPDTILMMVAAILDKPELRALAGLDGAALAETESLAETEPALPDAGMTPAELKNAG